MKTASTFHKPDIAVFVLGLKKILTLTLEYIMARLDKFKNIIL